MEQATPFLQSVIFFILQLVVFVGLIGVIVFVHELGHFLAARLAGVGVSDFAVGFGKSLWKKKKGNTTYHIKAIPLGGFVSIEGEDGKVDNSATNYNNKNWGQKVFILTAGVAMNFVLAIVLFAIYLSTSDYRVVLQKVAEYDFIGGETRTVLPVGGVIEGSPADGNIFPGEVIKSINGQTIASSDSFLALLEGNMGREIELEIASGIDLREVRRVKLTLPEERDKEGALLGATILEFYLVQYPYNVFSSVSHGINTLGFTIKVIGQSFTKAVQEGKPGAVVEQTGSIVAVSVFIGDIINSELPIGQVIEQLINLTALISMSLALVNILPIPALDGGHVMIATIETGMRRKLNPKVMDVINKVSLGLLISLSVIIMLKDIVQFDVVENLISSIRSVFGG